MMRRMNCGIIEDDDDDDYSCCDCDMLALSEVVMVGMMLKKILKSPVEFNESIYNSHIFAGM